MRFYGLVMISVTELVVTILGALFVGRWADGRFNTGNRYVVVGVIVGFVLGFVRLILRLQKVVNEPPEK